MSDEKLTLDDIEQDLINQVYGLEADNEKTTIAIENLKTIHQINEKPESVSHRLVPSGDSIVGAVCSIAGILAVLNYEQLHPLASKAVGFITKIRL
jgi:hypothetical protein|nr:MAG TPA: hypothetical protein [Caudoviricetes sp.]